jgi:hypothetical protein
MAKKQCTCMNHELIPPKIAESDTQPPDHGLCGSGVSIYNDYTIKKRSLIAVPMKDLKMK